MRVKGICAAFCLIFVLPVTTQAIAYSATEKTAETGFSENREALVALFKTNACQFVRTIGEMEMAEKQRRKGIRAEHDFYADELRLFLECPVDKESVKGDMGPSAIVILGEEIGRCVSVVSTQSDKPLLLLTARLLGKFRKEIVLGYVEYSSCNASSYPDDDMIQQEVTRKLREKQREKEWQMALRSTDHWVLNVLRVAAKNLCADIDSDVGRAEYAKLVDEVSRLGGLSEKEKQKFMNPFERNQFESAEERWNVRKATHDEELRFLKTER